MWNLQPQNQTCNAVEMPLWWNFLYRTQDSQWPQLFSNVQGYVVHLCCARQAWWSNLENPCLLLLSFPPPQPFSVDSLIWCTNTRSSPQFVKFSILTVVLAHWLPYKLLFKDKQHPLLSLPSPPSPPTSVPYFYKTDPSFFPPLPKTQIKHRVMKGLWKRVCMFSPNPKNMKNSLKCVFNVLSNPPLQCSLCFFYVEIIHTSLTSTFSLSLPILTSISFGCWRPCGCGERVWKVLPLALFLVYILFNLFYHTTVNPPLYTHKHSVVCFFQRKKFGLEAQRSFARIIHGE